jgi:hypothetical protein
MSWKTPMPGQWRSPGPEAEQRGLKEVGEKLPECRREDYPATHVKNCLMTLSLC